MSKLYFLSFLLSIMTFVSCDPEVCVDCEKPEIDFSKFMNKKHFTLSNEDSSIVHTVYIIDSTIDKSGRQCHINIAWCDYTNNYVFKSESLGCEFQYAFFYDGPSPSLDTVLITIELYIRESSYRWYNYRFTGNNLDNAYKMRKEYLDSIRLGDKTYYDVLKFDRYTTNKKSRKGLLVKFPELYYSIHNGIIGLQDENYELFTLDD